MQRPSRRCGSEEYFVYETSEEMFYRNLQIETRYGDAMLAPIRMGTNMADGSQQQKHLKSNYVVCKAQIKQNRLTLKLQTVFMSETHVSHTKPWSRVQSLSESRRGSKVTKPSKALFLSTPFPPSLAPFGFFFHPTHNFLFNISDRYLKAGFGAVQHLLVTLRKVSRRASCNALRWDKVITIRRVCIVQYRIVFSFHLASDQSP